VTELQELKTTTENRLTNWQQIWYIATMNVFKHNICQESCSNNTASISQWSCMIVFYRKPNHTLQVSSTLIPERVPNFITESNRSRGIIKCPWQCHCVVDLNVLAYVEFWQCLEHVYEVGTIHISVSDLYAFMCQVTTIKCLLVSSCHVVWVAILENIALRELGT
jgi:hypothetical protein